MTDESLVDDPRMKPARGLVNSIHPIRPIMDGKEKPIGKIGPDVLIADGSETPLDDERAKRKLVDPVQDGHLLVNE